MEGVLSIKGYQGLKELSEVERSGVRARSQARATSSLKKAEWRRCLPPRTIGSSYSNCRISISGRPFTSTDSAVSAYEERRPPGICPRTIELKETERDDLKRSYLSRCPKDG